MINDWAMKFLPPMRFRENTNLNGLASVASAGIFLQLSIWANHPDSQCTTTSMNGLKIHTYIVVLDSCKQDWFAVSCILENGTVSSEGKPPHRNTGKSQE